MSTYIVNASFETDLEHEAYLAQKCRHDLEESHGAAGLISFDIWKRAHAHTVEYVLVSKWESKEDFKAWISREDHVQGHKDQRQNKEEVRPKLTKRLTYFEGVL
ncbi:antibiotic biosynthesis monooxygenase family protein [Rufibacter psychrotolerans]|uniref:antibiotic biosynthesis monooxygenase family protein n=1 Tax=Rufibacter psychrotolerans TaxID=2812556 RepID=UPI001967ACA9|nr:antibiotic biosynthesis monooxygenase family protein [Rufibacter sp. SYSU D00308]